MLFLQNVPILPKTICRLKLQQGQKIQRTNVGQKTNHDSAKLHNNHPFSPSYFIYLPQLIVKYFLPSLGSGLRGLPAND